MSSRRSAENGAGKAATERLTQMGWGASTHGEARVLNEASVT
jgi:hypothetical protein